jgi:hypothetical protein
VVVVHVLILWGLVVVALGVALLAERRKKKGGDKPEYAVALAFVASSYGLLLELLVSFGASHYSDVRHQAQDEADSLLALRDSAGARVHPTGLRHAIDLVNPHRERTGVYEPCSTARET